MIAEVRILNDARKGPETEECRWALEDKREVNSFLSLRTPGGTSPAE